VTAVAVAVHTPAVVGVGLLSSAGVTMYPQPPSRMAQASIVAARHACAPWIRCTFTAGR
jgi:hypothetical protein